MSIKLMSQIWDLDLDHPQQGVLLALADHADDYGDNCYPAVARIAWKTGYSLRQTQRVMHELRAKGLLIEVAAARRGKPTEYAIRVAAAAKKQPYIPPLKLTAALRKRAIEAFDQVCQYCSKKGDALHGPDGLLWHVARIKQDDDLVRAVTLSCETCNRNRGAMLSPQRVIGVPSLTDWDDKSGPVGVPSETVGMTNPVVTGAMAPPKSAPEPSEPSIEPAVKETSEKPRARTREDKGQPDPDCPECGEGYTCLRHANYGKREAS